MLEFHHIPEPVIAEIKATFPDITFDRYDDGVDEGTRSYRLAYEIYETLDEPTNTINTTTFQPEVVTPETHGFVTRFVARLDDDSVRSVRSTTVLTPLDQRARLGSKG